jgi:hypothetical protein
MAKKHEILLSLIEGETGGVHPLISLVRIAKRSEANGDDNLAYQCYKEIANYVSPKLKSVEVQHNTNEVKPITIIVDSQAVEVTNSKLSTPLVEAELISDDDPQSRRHEALKFKRQPRAVD